MNLIVEHEAEGGISFITVSNEPIVRTESIHVDGDHLVGAVDVDADGRPVFVEILNIDLFPVAEVAARYGFTDQAEDLAVQIARIAATRTPLLRL